MNDRASAGFFEGVFDRTLTNLRSAWRDIALSARGVLSRTPRADLAGDDIERLREQMLSCLDARGGEVSARARAADLGRTYLLLDADGRERFLRLLAGEFDVDRSEIDRCCSALARADGLLERAAAERALRAALEPPRINLLRQFNALPEGVKFLVDRRAELIELARHDPLLRGLEDDLRRLLANWFDIGFLELRSIGWDSPASLLEKLMAYEAVHEIRSWADLKNRLEADRRCFAFFHPAHARRAADLCRGGAGRRHGRQHHRTARRSARRSATRRPPTPRSFIRSRTASAGSAASALAIF